MYLNSWPLVPCTGKLSGNWKMYLNRATRHTFAFNLMTFFLLAQWNKGATKILFKSRSKILKRKTTFLQICKNCTSDFLYRVSQGSLIRLIGVIGEVKVSKKLYGRRGGPKMQPWGDIRKILVCWLILQKKISKIRVAF